MELKKGRQYGATARERNQHQQAQKRHKMQPTLLSHARAARCNQDQDARRAAARRHTPRPPRPKPKRTKQRGSNHNDRREISHSRIKRKEGGHDDATGKERKQHRQAKKRQKRNQHLLATHTLRDKTKTKTPAVPPPAAAHHTRRAKHRNAQSNGAATRKKRHLRSHSRMTRKKGRQYDATARERKQHPQAQRRHKRNQQF
jgi:hypothetical protein